jgi:hypothetical protein
MRTTLRGGRAKIPIGTDGAIKVTQKESGDLHVKGVSHLDEGGIKAGALHGLGGEGGIDRD